jgi:hypothetical protein
MAYITRVSYCYVLERDSRRGFGLDVGFIGHFNTQLVITLNYSAISNFYTLQITITHTLVFSVCY